MKHWRLKLILTTLCCLLFVVAVKYLPALLCGGGESEVYHRYEHRDDLKVGFVKDYRVDDSTFVDVTTITARDSASWEALLKEMNVNNIILAKQRKAAREGRVTVIEYFCVKNHPEEKVKVKEYSDFDLVMCYYGEKTIYIFDVKSIEQSRIIKAHKNDELLN